MLNQRKYLSEIFFILGEDRKKIHFLFIGFFSLALIETIGIGFNTTIYEFSI